MLFTLSPLASIGLKSLVETIVYRFLLFLKIMTENIYKNLLIHCPAQNLKSNGYQ